jgi:uncharacterized glyoxalase superfamily protein PhnB
MVSAKPDGSQSRQTSRTPRVESVNRDTDAERVFHALAENGIVRMPLQKTFWAVRFGVVIDQFGIPWEINCGQPH